MPRTPAPRTARKKQWKRKPRRRAQLVVNKALHPIPQRYITKQKYSDIFALGAGTGSTFLYRLNSVFDPNRTGVGHQPNGFDQLAVLYNRYRVIACSWVINVQSTDPVRVGTLPTNEVPTLVSMSDFCERPRANWIIQHPGGNTQYLKGKCYLPSLVGRNKAEYMADDRYQSAVTTNPQEEAVLQIAGFNLADVQVNIFGTITLEYTVEYFDLNPLNQS